MRSLLFVPGDSERKLAKSLGSGADVLILDLEDSVSPSSKEKARGITREFLAAQTERRARLFVRVNPLRSGLILADLAAIMAARPDGIVLPKAEGGADVARLACYLDALEAREHLPEGATQILPIASETAAAVFALRSYAGSSPRLCGLMWGCEDLAAAIGAAENRRPGGGYPPHFALARSLCLFAAASAGVPAIDTVFTDYRDGAGLEQEARAAERDGFLGKAAIHPDQVAPINRAFTPDAAAVAWAERVVAAFAAAPDAGVVGLGGRMLDLPHLRTAQRVLERATAARLAATPDADGTGKEKGHG